MGEEGVAGDVPLPLGKLKDNDVVLANVGTIDERPRLAVWIGRICASWALVEGDILDIYALLMGIDIPRTKEAPYPRFHPLALQIFSALNALGARLDLLRLLAKERMSDDEFVRFRDHFEDRIWKRFTERSVVAHAIWGTCLTHPHDLIRMNVVGPAERYQEHHFKQVHDRIARLHSDLLKFLVEINLRLGQKT